MNDNFEIIKIYDIKSENSIKQRIIRKLFFDGIVFDNDFFDIKKIANTEINFLNIKQLDQNTRTVILGNILYKFTPDNPLYNYLDNGRAIYVNNHICCIFNDLNISQEELIIVDNWLYNKRAITFKKIWELTIEKNYYKENSINFYLLFKEDIEKIKTELYREKELEKHEELEQEKERQIKDLEEKAQERKIAEMKENYMILSRIEDSNIIIEDNYFIEKDKELKIVFDKKIIDIFTKEDIINYYNYNKNIFIALSYNNFIRDLRNAYYQGKYETSLIEKMKKLNKNWLHFKVYNYNIETKTEEFLVEIKIENKFIKDKYQFFINGIKIPDKKMSDVFNFFNENYYIKIDIIKNRLKNINIYLEQIKNYSGTQLKILQGKDFEIVYDDVKIPLHFEVTNIKFDKNNWQINFNGYKVTKTYKEIKEALYYTPYNDVINATARFSEFLGKEIEDKILDCVKVYIEKRNQAKQKAKQLFLDFVEKNKTKIIPKDNFWIVKGKLKNYKIAFKKDDDVGAWTYPNNNYVCINEKDKAGQELVGYDKLIQFALALMNDSKMREEISTLDR